MATLALSRNTPRDTHKHTVGQIDVQLSLQALFGLQHFVALWHFERQEKKHNCERKRDGECLTEAPVLFYFLATNFYSFLIFSSCALNSGKHLHPKLTFASQVLEPDYTSGLYCKHITIVNDDSRVISKRRSKLWHHLRA